MTTTLGQRGRTEFLMLTWWCAVGPWSVSEHPSLACSVFAAPATGPHPVPSRAASSATRARAVAIHNYLQLYWHWGWESLMELPGPRRAVGACHQPDIVCRLAPGPGGKLGGNIWSRIEWNCVGQGPGRMVSPKKQAVSEGHVLNCVLPPHLPP